MTLLTANSSPIHLASPKTISAAVNEIKDNSLDTIDDLLINRVQTSPNASLVAYPATLRGRSDYIDYTAKDLDRFADEAAKKFARPGLVTKHPSATAAEVIALLAPSNLDYIVSIFALSRMGFAILFLSNRLSTEAYINLLQKTKCRKLVAGMSNAKATELIQDRYPLSVFPILEKSIYDVQKPSKSRFPTTSYQNSSNRIAFIIHSSGSTGLPKPIFQTHKACLANYSSGSGFRAFLTLPLYHNHGISTLFRAIYSGKKISIFNANLPLSGSNLIEAMEAAHPESFHSVPYVLKLLAESERGISILKQCKLVLYGGSSCPDDLGDRLVKAGVHLVGHYGATEMGQLMTSFRSPEDKAWNYMRPLSHAKPFLRIVPRGSNSYECVVLDGLPSKVLSNSSDPPNSFYTSDTFSPHPTIPNAWKYLGRLDDRITLVNWEKILSIPYEHQVREHELVKEAVMFGIGRAVPGLIIVLSEKAAGMDKNEILETLMSVIGSANTRTEAFGRVPREMVEILDLEAKYPQTDKGTVIRAAFYKRFADLIDSIYLNFENPKEMETNRLILSPNELESYLLDVFRNKIGACNLQAGTDFFEAGIDSLQAITARARIMREIDLGSKILGQNAVFEYPNIQMLAKHLLSLRTGEEMEEQDELSVMAELIQKYSTFLERVPGTHSVDSETIILTGATGSLGAHILAQLVNRPNIKSVYCLVRANSLITAQQRVFSSLSIKKLGPFTDEQLEKIICLSADLSNKGLGLDEDVLKELKTKLTTVIHSAWAVNFNPGVRSFEFHYIKGTFNLLNLCLSVNTINPARLFFCSSISAAAGTPLPATIQEEYISELSHAQSIGYARSKLVAENIVRAACKTTGMIARVFRLGQIIGDTKHGLWNPTEAIPLMIQSATTTGALPALEETPSWMPVDEAARAVLELSGIHSGSPPIADPQSDTPTVYHVQNKFLFHWTHELLPALRAAGLDFEIVPQRE